MMILNLIIIARRVSDAAIQSTAESLARSFRPYRLWIHSGLPRSARNNDSAVRGITEFGAERRILVHRGDDIFPLRGGIETMPLADAIACVREHALL
jgi:hypothetical protein